MYYKYIYIVYVVYFPGDGSGRLAGGATAAPNCCSTSEVGSGDLKKRMTVSHTCPKL